VRHVAHMGETRNADRVFVGKCERMGQCGQSRHRWEHNIKMDMKEIGWEGMDWIHLAQNWDKWQAPVNTAGYESKNCALLGYYTAVAVISYRCFGTTYWSHHRLFQNNDKKLPLLAV